MFGWLTRKNTPNPMAQALSKMTTADREMYETAKAAIDEYDRYLELNPIAYEIRDVSKLPGPKNALVNAIRIEITLEQDEGIRQFLVEIGLKLALFREGIGLSDIQPFGLTPDQIDSAELSDKCLLEVSASLGPHLDPVKHETLLPQVQAEWRVLAEQFDKSISIARRIAG